MKNRKTGEAAARSGAWRRCIDDEVRRNRAFAVHGGGVHFLEGPPAVQKVSGASQRRARARFEKEAEESHDARLRVSRRRVKPQSPLCPSPLTRPNTQLDCVGSDELENILTVNEDGIATQFFRSRPRIKVPLIVKPLLRGKDLEFTDTRTFVHGSHTTLPFVQQFTSRNNISDRVRNEGTISIDSVVLNAEEGGGDVGGHDKTGQRICQIKMEGEVNIRLGPFSRKAEEVVIDNMRGAYNKFPKIIGEWMKMEGERKETEESAAEGEAKGEDVATPAVAAAVATEEGAMDGASEVTVSPRKVDKVQIAGSAPPPCTPWWQSLGHALRRKVVSLMTTIDDIEAGDPKFTVTSPRRSDPASPMSPRHSLDTERRGSPNSVLASRSDGEVVDVSFPEDD